MKVDLHVHTCYSPDSHASLEAIIRQCQKRRIDCIAITDHGTVDGALAMKKLAPLEVIVSEEVMSSQGEIIGYFLKETIPNGLPPEEVMDHIKEQGGLVCLPHPFDGMGRHPLAQAAREHLISEIDIIEVFNARSLSAKCGRMAREFAERHGLLASAGSDAHAPRHVGNVYVEMPAFDGPSEFKQALSQGQVLGHKTGFIDHFLTTLSTVPKRLRNHKYV